MPELPEVETVRRQLAKAVVGRTVTDVTVRFAGRLNVKPTAFVAGVRGAKFSAIRRRAKLLLLDLSNGFTLVTHLKMTGKYLLKPRGTEPSKHTHLVFALAPGKARGATKKSPAEDLWFEDIRKFGYVRLYKTSEIEALLADDYGPEPLDPKFTAEKFALCVSGRGNKKIKPLLLEQSCIAGVGNIYADEALWRAKVRPQRVVRTLSREELKALHKGIVGSMTESLKRGGTSADNFMDLYGKRGQNVPHLDVYGRGGEPCHRCKAPIKKITFAGRGTHFCLKCQR